MRSYCDAYSHQISCRYLYPLRRLAFTKLAVVAIGLVAESGPTHEVAFMVRTAFNNFVMLGVVFKLQGFEFISFILESSIHVCRISVLVDLTQKFREYGSNPQKAHPCTERPILICCASVASSSLSVHQGRRRLFRALF